MSSKSLSPQASLLSLVGIIAVAVILYAIMTQIAEPTTTTSELSKIIASPYASVAPEWSVYTNPRVGYQIQYKENNDKIDLDETIPYNAAETPDGFTQDKVQFSYDDHTYAVTTYFTSSNSTLDDWMNWASLNMGGIGAPSDYQATTIGAEHALSHKQYAQSYVKHNNIVVEIHALKSTGIADPSDAIYNHLLSTLGFTR